jgi:hypothetical protein
MIFITLTEIAVLTKINNTDSFEAHLFHFGENTRKMGGWFYNLEVGNYRVMLNEKQISETKISENNRTIEFSLPPQEPGRLKIEKLVS